MPITRKPGTKPLPEDQKPVDLDKLVNEVLARQTGLDAQALAQLDTDTAFANLKKKLRARLKPKPSMVRTAITGLQQARAEALTQAGFVQDLVFDDWYDRLIEDAQAPSEWTQARKLYESYLAHGRTFGRDVQEKRAAVQTLVTETQWGRMMATRFPKVRRGSGWHYPVRLKRGA